MQKTIFGLVEIGKYPDSESLCKAAVEAGVVVYDRAVKFLAAVDLIKTVTTVKLALVTPKELGFADVTHYDDILFAGKEQGYELCPAEVAAYVCMQHPELLLPPGPYIAMNCPNNTPVGHEHTLSVYTYNGISHICPSCTIAKNYYWQLLTKFLFVIPG